MTDFECVATMPRDYKRHSNVQSASPISPGKPASLRESSAAASAAKRAQATNAAIAAAAAAVAVVAAASPMLEMGMEPGQHLQQQHSNELASIPDSLFPGDQDGGPNKKKRKKHGGGAGMKMPPPPPRGLNASAYAAQGFSRR